MLEAIIDGVYDDIHDKFRPNQHVLYHSFKNIDLIYLTVSYKPHIRVDLRYAVIRFKLKSTTLTTVIHFHTRWYISDEKLQIDILDPKSFPYLANWLADEIIDGLKRGRSGRQEKRTNHGYKNFRS